MAVTPGGLINARSNTGKSMYIAPDPASVTTFQSLAAFPIQPGSDGAVGSATLLQCSTDDDNSEVITITLDNPNPFFIPTRLLPIAPSENILARPFGLIEWGVGGVQSQAEVDFDHGLNISVLGSYVRVTGFNPPIPKFLANIDGGDLELGFGRNVKLGAFCGYGAISGTRNLSAKRTVYIDTNPDPSPILVKIPPFGTNFTFQRQPSTTAMTVNVLDEAGIPIVSVVYPVGGGFENPVELSGDAAWLSINTPLPAPFVNSIRFIFGLSF